MLLIERLDRCSQTSLEDIVCKHHDNLVALNEVVGKRQRVGDTARPFLVGVEEPMDAVLSATAKETEELAGVGAPGHHHQFSHPRLDQRLYGIAHHWAVIDRQQVLVSDPRKR